MPRFPDLPAAVGDALHAPSVHNTQPWRWRIGPDRVGLYADRDRHLAATDPDRRDLLLSCGAALQHLQVALAARGLYADVRRFPDPEDARHLATVLVGPAGDDVDAASAALYPAITARRTDRRRMSHRPVPAGHVWVLREHARRAGAVLVPVADAAARRRFLALLAEAGVRQANEPGYAAELRTWTNRLPGSHDGVPAGNLAGPLPRPAGLTGLRAFGPGAPAQETPPPGAPLDDAAALLVLATRTDDVLARLRAGEAAGAVLLAATGMGLATTPLSQAVEIGATRREMRTGLLHIPEHPQLVLRSAGPRRTPARWPRPAPALHAVLLPVPSGERT
ncbi:hypothetical protein BJF78_02335 [Pseudonocardia sp. CNS-139]|nr:hypothetical protein BJF78_02335 [Pseudonocardia sp. CNS-139]